MPTNKKTSEKELLRAITRMIASEKTPTRGVVLGIGDDTAVIRPKPTEDLLLTTDILVEGTHFERKWFTGFELGWRLAAVNLSDIAAMGGRPLHGLLSLAIPKKCGARYIHGIERGVRDHLAAHGAVVVGGNVSAIENRLVCDLTLVGACGRGRAWRRSARPDRDAVVVVGFLGDARAGLALLKQSVSSRGKLVRAFKKPAPLIDIARHLATEKAIHGAIDVSDGLSTDLIHICENSGVGCDIESSVLPVSHALRRFCAKNDHDPQSWALHGGEDYALILSVEAKRAPQIAARIERDFGVPARVIGRFTGKKGFHRCLDHSGRWNRLVSGGWDHFG